MQNDLQSALESEQSNILSLSSFQSDNLIEKLKLLNYEKHLRELKLRPLNKYYFIKPTNPGEKFFVFASLSVWLIRKLGKNSMQPKEFDDPNTLIGNIMKVLQEMDISIDFPSSKIIQGAGPVCIFILDCLLSQVFKVSKITLCPLQIEPEEETFLDHIEDNAEIILEKVEEQILVSDNSDDEDGLLKLSSNVGRNECLSHCNDFNENENWRLELEKALPQLKVVVKADSTNWRSHLSQIQTFKTNIESTTEDVQSKFKKLQSDITFAIEKIENREKHLNNEFQNYIKQFKDISVELSNAQSALKELEILRDNISEGLSDVINENERIKIQMEQKGASMSDGSPVINIKNSIAKLKENISQMNVEIRFLTRSIDQDILRQTSLYAELETMPVGTN